MTRAAWNVAIISADLAAGEEARQELEASLAVLSVCADCHVRQWQYGELSDTRVFEAAVDHALDADLVVLAVRDSGPLPVELQAVLADWLIRSGNDACPLAVAGAPSIGTDETCEGTHAWLRDLTNRAHVPLYANLRDAVLIASDLWQWKHFPWAAAAADPSVGSRFDFLSPGQRRTALHCRGASPCHVRAGTGGTSRRALTVSRREPSVRRCQP